MGAFYFRGSFSSRGRWAQVVARYLWAHCLGTAGADQSPFGVSNPQDKEDVPVPSHTDLPALPPQTFTAYFSRSHHLALCYPSPYILL